MLLWLIATDDKIICCCVLEPRKYMMVWHMQPNFSPMLTSLWLRLEPSKETELDLWRLLRDYVEESGHPLPSSFLFQICKYRKLWYHKNSDIRALRMLIESRFDRLSMVGGSFNISYCIRTNKTFSAYTFNMSFRNFVD